MMAVGVNRNVVDAVGTRFSQHMLQTKIRIMVALASPRVGLDIFRYSPRANGADDYTALAWKYSVHSSFGVFTSGNP
jgi:chromosome partitioning protein